MKPSRRAGFPGGGGWRLAPSLKRTCRGKSMTDAYLIIGGVLFGGAALYAIPSVERRLKQWRARRRRR
jgi:hypothetical protein